MKFVRYADDFVVMIAASLHEAKFIKFRIKDLLKANCVLELNDNKTIISSMSEKWNFLGAEIKNPKLNETWFVNPAIR